jgi:hypothetical protein
MQKTSNVPQLPAHVKKAIEQITSQIEYLNLILNAPPPIEIKTELRYNKDEVIVIPNSIFIVDFIDSIKTEIKAKQSAIRTLEQSFVLQRKDDNNLFFYGEDFDWNVQHTYYVQNANSYSVNIDYEYLDFLKDFNIDNYNIVNRYDLIDIPAYILNTIKL